MPHISCNIFQDGGDCYTRAPRDAQCSSCFNWIWNAAFRESWLWGWVCFFAFFKGTLNSRFMVYWNWNKELFTSYWNFSRVIAIIIQGWHYLWKKTTDMFSLLLSFWRKAARMTYDTRTSLALFRSFSASDYVSAQCLRWVIIMIIYCIRLCMLFG